MTITAATPPAHRAPVDLARGFLTGGVLGTSLAALVAGIVIERVPLFVTGLAVPAVYGLLVFLAGAPRRLREASVAPCTALAVIESREAVKGEETDVPVRFDLTVAPDGAPAYRVEIRQDVHIADLPDYRPQSVVVVEYAPDRPWQVRIVKRPTPEWEERAAGARIDSAPGPAVVSDPPEGAAAGFATLFGLLLGAAAVVLLFRADLFPQGGAARQPSPKPSVFSTPTPSTTIVTSASSTMVLGPGRSLLDDGELRRAVDSLTQGKDRRRAVTLVVQNRLLSIVFLPTGKEAPHFDLRSVPYDRIPSLVTAARTTLGVESPRSWQLTADRVTGSLTIRITVTGSEGTASMEADGRGEVVRRSPVR
ncbi:hypothetical protein GCM10023088_15060 [Actinomadura verrucosospora]|uniref:hypothetical protein n=1 Tax=Actinomadura verrucosospora TaxID=46165 RepID=UPI0031EABA42